MLWQAVLLHSMRPAAGNIIQDFRSASLSGWINNIGNPRVRAAFPEANNWYNHYISNNSDNLILNRTLEPPPKRSVPLLFPEPTPRELSGARVQNPNKSQGRSTASPENILDRNHIEPEPPMNIKRRMEALRRIFGHLIQPSHMTNQATITSSQEKVHVGGSEILQAAPPAPAASSVVRISSCHL